MPCKVITDTTGEIVVIACSRSSRPRCHICGKPHVALCDATRRDGRPCDAAMCEEHRITIGEDTDICGYHNKPYYIKQAIENRQKRGDK